MWKRFDKDDIVSVCYDREDGLYIVKGDVENFEGGLFSDYTDLPEYWASFSDIEKIKAYLAKNYGLKYENIIDRRDWRWYDKNSKIVVSWRSLRAGLSDQYKMRLFFTLKDNITLTEKGKFDFKNIYKHQILPDGRCFRQVRKYLVERYGFKPENIEELEGNEDVFYKQLGYYESGFFMNKQNYILGAVIGDIVGSRFEWNNYRKKDFQLLNPDCFITDDTIMTLAVAKALMDCGGDYTDLSKKTEKAMREIGQNYPDSGYGGRFFHWMFSDNPKPYGSYGNGAAMRVSACGLMARNLGEAKELSYKVTRVTHNHPEGIKGAEAVTVAIFLARCGCSKEGIGKAINDHYYPMDFTLNEIRDEYEFDETCQGSVPQAIVAFLESAGFEDAIRNAVSIGGDSDTIAAITGSIAGVYYGIPHEIQYEIHRFIDTSLLKIIDDFEEAYLQI